MYKKILVALDNSKGDNALLSHIEELAKIHGSHLFLLHVADGWVARNYNDLLLKESEEMVRDREYLENIGKKLQASHLEITTHLVLGDPPEGILKFATDNNCDLIAMTSHGHRFLADIFFGSTIEEVRHRTTIPMLIIKPCK
jgi:nucleotide-binding universal stress UspA family protein